MVARSRRRPRPGPSRAQHALRLLAGAAIVVLLAQSAAACLPASIRPTSTPPPTPSPTPSPSPTPTPTPAPPTPTPGPTFLLHTVVRGDTLTSIAKRYKTTARSIAYWNRDLYPSLDPESARYNPNRLERGWVLRILPRQLYTPPPDDGETGESPTPTPPDDEYEPLPSESAQPES